MTGMPKYGTAKDIYWDDTPETIVYGHVSADEYRNVSGYTTEHGEHVSHLWGRWTPSSGDYDRILRCCEGPARGAFAFTIRTAVL
jgi:hypothetical protein